MNNRFDSGHVNNGFNANEEFGSSVHFDTQHYDEIDLGVKRFQDLLLSTFFFAVHTLVWVNIMNRLLNFWKENGLVFLR
ncbi:hypothetical protein C0J52_15347 [Blattella germanica]|nr:hypothetical protein C0J52_15347 [Blattella germanica]